MSMPILRILTVLLVMETSISHAGFLQRLFGKTPEPLSASGRVAWSAQAKERDACFLGGVRSLRDLERWTARLDSLAQRLPAGLVPQEAALVRVAYDFDRFTLLNDWSPQFGDSTRQREARDLLWKNSATLDSLAKTGWNNPELRLMQGEVALRKMSFVGMSGGGMAAIEYSTRGREHLEAAVDLDESLGRAWVVLGTWYLFAPDIAGGSPQVALKLISKGAASGTGYDRFMSHVWAGVCRWEKLKDRPRAMAEFDRALALVPGHPWVVQMKSRLAAGRPKVL